MVRVIDHNFKLDPIVSGLHALQRVHDHHARAAKRFAGDDGDLRGPHRTPRVCHGDLLQAADPARRPIMAAL
jgi:hypothetical protein